MSYESDKLEWLMSSSPKGKFIIKGRNLVPYKMSNKTMCRIRYLARKQKVSYRGFLIKAIYKGIVNV